MIPSRHVVIAGGTGFIGQAVSAELRRNGYGITLLSRHAIPPHNGIRSMQWTGQNPGPWQASLEKSAAVINLSGRSVNCRYNDKNKEEILHSRVDSTLALGVAIDQCTSPPPLWINASSIGFYGNTGNDWADESSPPGDDFLSRVTRQWEEAHDQIALPQTRKVRFRIGLVLDQYDGILKPLTALTRAFLGGPAGSGFQWMSWIHRSDLAALIRMAIDDEQICGIYNAVAPNPVRNREFMKMLRRALHRPWSPPVPRFAVKTGAWLLNSSGDLALNSARVRSDRLPEIHFQHTYPNLSSALDTIFRDPS